MQKCHQSSFVVKKCFNKVTKVYFGCLLPETNCVHNSCHINENNMFDRNTGFLILKVHIWHIMFARGKYLQSFRKSGVPIAKHADRADLRAFKSSAKSVN